MMHIDQQKEQFSFAYVRAVATAAGFAVSEPSVDDDSIDLQIASRSTVGTIKRPRLELQAKCLAGETLESDSFSYPVKIKNYNDLRDTEILVPRILVVVRVPEQVHDWLDSSDEALILRRCGYWASLRGMPDTDNKTTVSVPLPRQNRFTVDALCGMMERIETGQHP